MKCGNNVASRLAVTLIAVGLLAMPVAVLLGDDAAPFPGQKSQWNGYDRYDFSVDGRNCLVVVPKTAAAGKPWIWRTEFFGHEPQADLALLAKGFHAVYIDVQNMYGGPPAMKHMDAFYDRLTGQHGLSKKTVLEGFSRGGLFAFNWAARHPDRVACIYVDAPVCDFKSWPGGKGKGPGSPADWQNLLKVYGLTEAEALAYRHNPIDNLRAVGQGGRARAGRGGRCRRSGSTGREHRDCRETLQGVGRADHCHRQERRGPPSALARGPHADRGFRAEARGPLVDAASCRVRKRCRRRDSSYAAPEAAGCRFYRFNECSVACSNRREARRDWHECNGRSAPTGPVRAQYDRKTPFAIMRRAAPKCRLI